MSQTQALRLMRIGWETVSKILAPVVQDKLDRGRPDGLRFIGVDEVSYGADHKFLTCVARCTARSPPRPADVFFCDAHSPWQRASNENMNGLLRDYSPKGTDLSVFSDEELQHLAVEVNARPRKTLSWAGHGTASRSQPPDRRY